MSQSLEPLLGNDPRAAIRLLMERCGNGDEAWTDLQAAVIELIACHSAVDELPWSVEQAVIEGLFHLSRSYDEEPKAIGAFQAVLEALLPLLVEGRKWAWAVFYSGVLIPLAERWVPQQVLHDRCTEIWIKLSQKCAIGTYISTIGLFVPWLRTVFKHSEIDIRGKFQRDPHTQVKDLPESSDAESPLETLIQTDLLAKSVSRGTKVMNRVWETLHKLPEIEFKRREPPTVRLSPVQLQQAYTCCLGGKQHGEIAKGLGITNVEISRLLERVDVMIFDAVREDPGGEDLAAWLFPTADHALFDLILQPEQHEGVRAGLKSDESELYPSRLDLPAENLLREVEKALRHRLRKKVGKRLAMRLQEKGLPEQIWPTAFLRVFISRETPSVVVSDLSMSANELREYLQVCRKCVYEALREDFPALEDNLSEPRW